MSVNTFHYPSCERVSKADRFGVCNCEEVFDIKHADMKKRCLWLFNLYKKVTFHKIKV